MSTEWDLPNELPAGYVIFKTFSLFQVLCYVYYA